MKRLSTPAQAAQLIRKELKEAFKGVKFKVSSRSGSTSSAIYVYWTDGPSSEQVNKIVAKYEYGTFDGMTDSYEYNNVRKDLPQVTFVLAERMISEQAIKEAYELYFKFWTDFEGVTDFNQQVYNQRYFSIASEARRILSNVDLTNKLTLEAITCL